jgi:Putative beta-barrel porin 2
LELQGSDTWSYDDNVYRLSPTITDLAGLPGIAPGAVRQDHINTASARVDGQWSSGRQIVVGDFNIDDHRYDSNKDLNNVSDLDRLVWYWNAAGLFSGQIGANYTRNLATFVNSTTYARNVVEATSYYATGRYQVGPRWALFGGILESGTALTEAASQANDSHTKSVDFGTEYATGGRNTLGWEYRYTDARYPLGLTVNDDYREDTWRVYERYALSEKTELDVSGGYLKRDYAATTIESFSGYVWRAGAEWHPTERLQFEAAGWRNLQAYITAQSDYYVSNGGSISARWDTTEKVYLTVDLSYQTQDYIGLGASEVAQGSRRDKLNSARVSIDYVPIKYVILNLGYSHENRGSNETPFRYTDNLLDARFTVRLGTWAQPH